MHHHCNKMRRTEFYFSNRNKEIETPVIANLHSMRLKARYQNAGSKFPFKLVSVEKIISLKDFS